MPPLASHIHFLKIFIFKVEAKVTFVFLEVSCFKGLKSDLFVSEETETIWR